MAQVSTEESGLSRFVPIASVIGLIVAGLGVKVLITPHGGDNLLASIYDLIGNPAGAALLRSPVSGHPCVYWRVRITQRLTDRSQLVHEIESEESFELRWRRSDRPHDEIRLRLVPEAARIQAPPVLHREGTPEQVADVVALLVTNDYMTGETVVIDGGLTSRIA